MRRWLWILGASLVLLSGNRRANRLENLIPAELLMISREGPQIILEVDTGESGQGTSLETAFDDLEEKAEGRILWDTLDKVVIRKEALDVMPKLRKELSPGTEVWLYKGNIEAEKAAAYLKTRNSPVRLLGSKGQKDQLPVLSEKGGEYRIENG